MGRTVLVLGGRSEIGIELAQRLVADGADTVVLAARRSDDLAPQVSTLRAAGAQTVETAEFDADDTSRHEEFLDALDTRHGAADDVIVSFGILGDQERAETDAAHAVAVVHTDFVAQVSLLTLLAHRMRRRGSGALVVFSSIAGVRVRRANYVYGSAKAGLDGFASGLSDALHGTGVRLLLVRPGFVIGRMTEGMSPAPLSSTPAQVADAAARALRRGRAEVWVPGRLRLLAAVFALVPRAVWRRMPR